MSGYNKTTIIDCARSQSEESIANNDENPSQWTNRVGTGFRVKPGDQISVHSSFISELGAQTGQIQIKGQKLGETEASITGYEYLLRNEDLPEKYTLVNISNTTQKIDVRDDTLNLVVSPYKNANCDNYLFLPRKWAGGTTATTDVFWGDFDMRYEASPGVGVTPAKDIGACRCPPRPLNRCSADLQTVYRPITVTTEALRQSKVAMKNDNSRYTIFARKQTYFGDVTAARVSLTGKTISAASPVINLTHGSETTNLLVGMTLFSQSPETAFTTSASILSITPTTVTMSENASIKTTGTNNIFTFQIPSTSGDEFLPATTLNSTLSASQCEALRDPAVFGDYVQVRDLISLSAKPGYNSPTDLAVQLTEEINQRSEIEDYTYKLSNAAETKFEDVTVTFTSETPAYKHYHCGTATNYQKSYFDQWFLTNGLWDIEKAYHYLSNYQFIGIKRPEIYVAGLQLNDAGGMNIGDPAGTNFLIPGDQVLMTGLLWNDENLIKFKPFFDSQPIYPEVFEGYEQTGIPVSPKESRFLHMNLFDNENAPASLNPTNFGTNIRDTRAPGFGYDLYNAVVSGSQTSFPIFVDYNINSSFKTADDVGYTEYGFAVGSSGIMTTDFDDLAYGFARKVRRKSFVAGGDVQYYIGFQFQKNGGEVPSHFFHANASNGGALELGSGKGRQFGFDRHFQSYANSMMLLYNGNPNARGQDRGDDAFKGYTFAQQSAQRGHYLEKYQFGMYLGAEGPLINFDQQQQRFTISDFHSHEMVGNTYNAGDQNQYPNIPDNPEATDACYKINKRMLGTNYTPEMTPYTSEFKTSWASGSSATYSANNPNVSNWKIFDSRCGIFIEDWLVPEKNWIQSLAGIMGFQYSQFHNPNSLSSRQVRIRAHGSNADLNNVNIITTNADVQESDLVQYSRNVWNAANFEPSNPVGLQLTAASATAFRARFITPAITISPAESVKITAERLPTKTLRPYYTIRSDILQENNYLGGNKSGITLPIVSIVNKANPYGDFLNGLSSQITFTNTVDRVLTSIRCSIHEPDGTFARVDLNSAVIFKIDQQMNVQLDLVDQLLSSKVASDRKIAMELEGIAGQPV